jgi:hypothetical protein
LVTKIQEEEQSNKSEAREDDSSELLPGVDVKVRDACRLIRALRKISCEIRGPWKPKPKNEEKKAYKAFITLEDQVGIHHLRHRVGRMEELQTTLSHPHQFWKTLIRVHRLKNLRWSLLHVDREGNRARMPELMQILEEDAECVLVIEYQKRKRPNTPGTSKRRHFERANQKRGRGILNGTRHRKRILTRMIHRAMKRGARGVDITKKGIQNGLLGQRRTRIHTSNLRDHQVGNPWFLFHN